MPPTTKPRDTPGGYLAQLHNRERYAAAELAAADRWLRECAAITLQLSEALTQLKPYSDGLRPKASVLAWVTSRLRAFFDMREAGGDPRALRLALQLNRVLMAGTLHLRESPNIISALRARADHTTNADQGSPPDSTQTVRLTRMAHLVDTRHRGLQLTLDAAAPVLLRLGHNLRVAGPEQTSPERGSGPQTPG